MGGTVSVAGLHPTSTSWVQNEKIAQRILRHANLHVTKDRYIKAFDPAVLDAMQRMQATVDAPEKSPAAVTQMN